MTQEERDVEDKRTEEDDKNNKKSCIIWRI